MPSIQALARKLERLNETYDGLQQEWKRRNDKIRRLRVDLAAEAGTAIKFQLEQQIQDGEAQLESLNAEIQQIEVEIEQTNVELEKAGVQIDGAKIPSVFKSAEKLIHQVPVRVIWLLLGILAIITILIGIPGARQFLGLKTQLSPSQNYPEIGFENFVDYENPDYKIKIKRPNHWVVQEKDDPFVGVVTFLAPGVNELDTSSSPAKLTVSVEKSSQLISLEEYKRSSIKQIENDPEAKVLISESSDTTLSNITAYKLVYINKHRQKTLKKMEIVTLNYGKAYILTYEAEEKKYSDFLGLAQAMIKSFEISSH
jgi:hypothetical protein